MRRGARARWAASALAVGLSLVASVAVAEEPLRRAAPEYAPADELPSAWEVPAVGPVLTFVGGALFVTGATVAAVGATSCTDLTCDDRRTPMILGGVGGAAALGTVGLAVGSHLWRHALGEADDSFEDAPNADNGMVAGGIVLTVVGAAGTIGGAYFAFVPLESAGSQSNRSVDQRIVAAALVGGAVAFSFGVPLLTMGARNLPRDQTVDLHAGPGHVSLAGTF